MSPGTLQGYAMDAGLTGEMETYELGHPFFRLYGSCRKSLYCGMNSAASLEVIRSGHGA